MPTNVYFQSKEDMLKALKIYEPISPLAPTMGQSMNPKEGFGWEIMWHLDLSVSEFTRRLEVKGISYKI